MMMNISRVNCWSMHMFCRRLNKNAKLFAKRQSSMLAWKINNSMDNQQEIEIQNKLQLMETKIPTISSPWDVLVKIHSTSINSLDVRMVFGYGRRVLDILDIATNFEPRITNDRYPLTLGRDFSGEVIATGPCARNYRAGDLVYGAVEPQRSGAHAQYVSVPSYCLAKKPTNLTHTQAASIPFVSLTAYSALSTFGGLNRNDCSGKQVLVIGGSGGVGSFAIQLLKLWGANVVATCSGEKMEWLEETLFVDEAINHNDPMQLNSLVSRFDFVLDCGDYDRAMRTRQEVVESSLKCLKPYSRGIYVTLSPPLLSNTDKHGLLLGTAGSMLEAACDTIISLTNLNSARWAVFLPNKSALDYVTNLYEDEAIAPQVSSVFSFNQMSEAYEELQTGKARGKVVVDVTKFETDRHQSTTNKTHSKSESSGDSNTSGNASNIEAQQ